MAFVLDEELQHLRADAARFRWLLRIWVNVTGERMADVIRDLDELQSRGADLAEWSARHRRGGIHKRPALAKRPPRT